MKFIPQAVFATDSILVSPPAGPPPPAAPPPAAPPPAAPPPAAPPPAAPPAGDSWFTKLSADDQAYAANKGWKADTDPSVIMQSYQNIEKLMGADKAGRTVMLPKDANDTEALNTIYEKLGKPKDPSGYSIELPQGADTQFADTARGWFHKGNLTVDQAKFVTEQYRAFELDTIKKMQDDHATQVEGLQKEWGDKYDGNVETARAALKAAGFSDDEARKMEYAIGPAAFAKKFEFFGRNYKEAAPPGTETRTAQGFNTLTPVQAQQKMETLRADPNFMQRYDSPDPKVRAQAIQEMDDLAKLAVNAKVS
jgi:hypothetical protein